MRRKDVMEANENDECSVKILRMYRRKLITGIKSFSDHV